MQLFDLSGKIVLLTGGGSGIGKAIAHVFSRQGAVINIIELNEKAAQQSVQDILAEGGKARAYCCDVTNQQQVISIVQNIINENGRTDILVNCAGIAQVGKLENTTEQDFEKIFSVNVKGTYNTMHAVIEQMKVQQYGVILNMASVASSVGIADRFAYSMSKGAVLAMTLSVAKDYIKEGIRCNCLSPARVHTPFVDGFISRNYPGKEKEMFQKLSASQPIGRMAKPEEVAYLALYLCSDAAEFITGCDYPVDGGFIKLNN